MSWKTSMTPASGSQHSLWKTLVSAFFRLGILYLQICQDLIRTFLFNTQTYLTIRNLQSFAKLFLTPFARCHLIRRLASVSNGISTADAHAVRQSHVMQAGVLIAPPTALISDWREQSEGVVADISRSLICC